MPANATFLAAAAGGLSALLAIAPVWAGVIGMVLSLFAHAPLFAVGLGKGPTALLAAGIAGAAVSGLIAGFNPGGALFYAAAYAAPVGLIVLVAFRHRGEAAAIVAAGLVAVAALSMGFALFLWYSFGGAINPNAVIAMLRAALQMTGQAAPDEAQMRLLARVIALMLPGGWGSIHLTMLLIGFTVGQAVVTRSGNAASPTPRMSDVVLPTWAPALLALGLLGVAGDHLSAALGLSAPELAPVVGVALLLVTMTAAMFAGMAIVHAWAEGIGAGRALLVAAYFGVFGVGLFFLAGLPLLAAAGLGFLEPWLGLRHKLRGPGRT